MGRNHGNISNHRSGGLHDRRMCEKLWISTLNNANARDRITLQGRYSACSEHISVMTCPTLYGTGKPYLRVTCTPTFVRLNFISEQNKHSSLFTHRVYFSLTNVPFRSNTSSSASPPASVIGNENTCKR